MKMLILRQEKFVKCEKAFDEPDVHCINKPNNVICKHCKQSIRHHHKTLSVEGPLRKCKPLKKLMPDMAVSTVQNVGKLENSLKPKMTTITKSNTSNQKSLTSFVVSNFNDTDQKKFNREIAMYFYCTGPNFMRVEDTYLHLAIQLA